MSETVRDRLVLDIGSKVEPSAISADNFITGIIAGATAAVAALAGLTVWLAATGDAAAKAARGADVTTEQYQRLGIAADFAGVSQQSFVTAVTQGNQRLAEAAKSGGKAAEAYAAVGINAKRAAEDGQTFADLLPDILDGLNGLGASERALAGSEIFGRRRYAEFASLIAGGSEGLQTAFAEADASRAVITDETGAAAESLTDAFTSAQLRARGFAVTLGSRLVPAVDRLIRFGLRLFDALSPAAFEALDFAGQGLAATLDALISPVGRVASGLALLGATIQGARLLYAVPAVSSALAAAAVSAKAFLVSAAPIAVAVLGLALAVEDMSVYMAGGDSMIGRLAESMGADSELYAALTSLGPLLSSVGDLASESFEQGMGAVREAIRGLGPDFAWLEGWLDAIGGTFGGVWENIARGAVFATESIKAFTASMRGEEVFSAEERATYGSAREALAARAKASLATTAEERAVQQEAIRASRGAPAGAASPPATVNVYPAPGMSEEQIGRAAGREATRSRRSGTAMVAP